MAFEYVEVEEAIERPGLRMVVVGDLPSGWSEAAKGILHIKGIDWVAVRLRYDSAPLKRWIRRLEGPVAVYEDERPRHAWTELLLLAERLRPEQPLLPSDAATRALCLGLSHELCSEGGLGWARRLQLVHAGLQGSEARRGFPQPVAEYLAAKYGYRSAEGESWGLRVSELLRMLTERLQAQRAAGRDYYVGDRLTAVDVYSAAFMAMVSPLPETQCKMNPAIRRAFEYRDAQTTAALDPLLIAHRDMMYERHLESQLSL